MTEEKNIVPEEQHFGGKRDLKRLFRQSKKSQFSFSSCLFYPHFGVRFLLKGFPLFMSSLFNPETVSSLLCCYRYTALLRVQVLPSGAPFSLSCFWIVKKKTFCVFFSLRGSFIFCKSSPVFSWRAVFLLSPGLCFFLSLSFSLLWVSEAQLCFSTLRWWTREGSNSRNAAWLGGLGSLGGSLSPSPSHRLLFLSEIFFAANFLLSLQSV